VYSKLFEFFDTTLLILKGKNVMFLHWYHHLTVIIYAWQGTMYQVSGGLIYSSLNYFVHSIMYFYYFLMAFDFAKRSAFIRKKVAKCITYTQLTQFILALNTLVYHTYLRLRVKSCDGGKKVDQLGFVIYGSYLLLFIQFFVGKYTAAPKPATKKPVAGAVPAVSKASLVPVNEDDDDDDGAAKKKLTGS
jgi:hypothetical protein